MKKIIMSVGMLLLAAALFGTSTYAWFSMNREVSAKGMNVKAKVDSSLVITKETLPHTETNTITVSFETKTNSVVDVTELHNSTHQYSKTQYGMTDFSDTRLVKVSNPQYVDQKTGLLRTDIPQNQPDYEGDEDPIELEYAAATNDDTNKKYYYVDYIVYVASIGADVSKKLTITLDGAYTSTKAINGAMSADFYMIQGADATKDAAAIKNTKTAADFFGTNGVFLGTLNLAQVDSKDTSEQKLSIETESAVLIPAAIKKENQNTVLVSRAFLIRVYVDGNLQLDGEDHTLVNNKDAIDVENLNLSVNFKLAD